MKRTIVQQVDPAHCERAADELYLILLERDRAFAARWRVGAKRFVGVLRIFILALSILGAAVCVVGLILEDRGGAGSPLGWLIPVFAGFAVLSFYLPRSGAAPEWTTRWAERRTRRTAAQYLSVARKLAPFEARYTFSGDTWTYTRYQEGREQKAWSRNVRKIRGRALAIQAESITVVFRTQSSFIPWMTILHEHPDLVAEMLRDAGVDTRRLGISEGSQAHEANNASG